MKSKFMIAIGIIILIISGIIIYLNFFWHPTGELPSIHKNIKMENELREATNEVIERQKQKGIDISIKEIVTYTAYQGYIDLNCGEIDFEREEEIVGSIANNLFERYPEDYGIDGKLWFDVHCKYDMGWMVSDGNYGPRI